MTATLNYTNTKYDLELAKTRLSLLIDKKTALYCKYFPTTSNIKEIVVDGGDKENDKMALYVHDLTKIDPNTGKSLEQEITDKLNDVNKLQYYLNLMDYSLIKLTGIEADLYREIVLNDTRVSKAVEKIAEKYDKDVSTIWRLYHKTIKKDIQKLKC